MFHVKVSLRKQPTFRDATTGALAKIRDFKIQRHDGNENVA